jgi:hypothetical protein
MSLVAFAKPIDQLVAGVEAPDLVAALVVALNILGEPATLPELSALLQDGIGAVRPAPTPGDIARVLCDARLPDGPDGHIFRCVDLRGAQAWAFTPAFRIRLRQAGLTLTLRSSD